VPCFYTFSTRCDDVDSNDTLQLQPVVKMMVEKLEEL